MALLAPPFLTRSDLDLAKLVRKHSVTPLPSCQFLLFSDALTSVRPVANVENVLIQLITKVLLQKLRTSVGRVAGCVEGTRTTDTTQSDSQALSF